MKDEQLYSIALTRIRPGAIGIHKLVDALGNATAVFRNRKDLCELVCISQTDKSFGLVLKRSVVPKKSFFLPKNEPHPLSDTDRWGTILHGCVNVMTPSCVLYYRGNADLNALKIINIVGTRHATAYGRDICIRFLEELAAMLPEVLVVSGLAYGIDIHAHRAALAKPPQYNWSIGTWSDRIYPSAHRKTAIENAGTGRTVNWVYEWDKPDRQNFVRRNRIVAGMSDATIICWVCRQEAHWLQPALPEVIIRIVPPSRTDKWWILRRGCKPTDKK